MNHRQLRVMTFAITSVALPFSSANSAIDIDSLESQRALFTAVEKKLKKKDSSLYHENLPQLKGYPLSPYLQSLDLANRLSELSQKDIDNYVTSWPSLPSNNRLQQQWLDHLARKNRWSDYLKAFERSDIYHVKYQCLNGVALYKQGNNKEAWIEATRLWLVGKSQNKACDPLFTAWKADNGLTQQLAFDRFWLAAAKGNTQLARYIDKSITRKKFKEQTALFWQVHNKPQSILSNSKLDKTQDRHQFIYLYGVKRLARRDIDKAVGLWLKSRDTYPFSLNEIAQLDKWLAIRLAKNFNDNASEYMALLDPLYSYPEVTEWRVRLALTNQDWASVLKLTEQLPEEHQEKSRWKYWQAVATIARQEEQGELDNDKTILKQDIFADISQERGFYGFLVADMSNAPFQLNHEKETVSNLPLEKLVSEFDAFKRIQEWIYHQRYYSAQSELNRLKPSLTSEQRKMVAYLAQQWEWHYQAILTAARESLWNDLNLRFPSYLPDVFDQHSKKQAIDESWAIAIARQESAFNPRARSHAGAKGLMQLMPATAKQTARNFKIKYRRESDLYKPTTNIALGTAHLSKLIEQFEGNKIFATAAYNAGASRVNSWLKKRGHLPLDIWIETIPFDETRQYVQNVLAFRVIYNSLNNEYARMLTAKEASLVSISPLSPRPLPLSKSLLTQRDQ